MALTFGGTAVEIVKKYLISLKTHLRELFLATLFDSILKNGILQPDYSKEFIQRQSFSNNFKQQSISNII